MIRIEEYIARRKKEDGLNEFDLEVRSQNMKLCVDYVFEYFNNYLNITEAEERTVLQSEKMEKYRLRFRDYEPEVADWCVSIYRGYGKQMDLSIGRLVKQDDLFFLYNTDSEFRGLSYDIYTKLIKRLPFLREQTEMLFLFIKDYHRIQSQRSSMPIIAHVVDVWMEETWKKHQVSIAAFASAWIMSFSDNEGLWPSSHRRKSKYSFRKYDYDHRQKGNLFGIDSLYRKMPKKAFIKGRKQEFEIIFMYYWLHEIEGDSEGYWQAYLDAVLPALEGK
ncbi:MAG: hypothetical protein GX979_08545 [Firmicutes bacterium]|nr:hypothetical protein [Bacillota bacterium]